jgi:hypothetical protein
MPVSSAQVIYGLDAAGTIIEYVSNLTPVS